MNTELIDKSATSKEIRIEVAPEEVRGVYDTVSRKYANQAQVPGFRKGMAPLDVIRMRYKDEIRSDVIQELIPPKVTEAIIEHQLSPLVEPHLHLDDAENVKVNGSQPLALSVHVEVMPEIPEPKYKGLEAIRRVKPIDDAEIDNVIDEQRQQESTLVPIEDRKSKDGDTVILDLKGTFDDDPKADPIEVNDLEVQLGDEVIEKSFSDNLIGVEAEDEKEFTIDYAEDFSSAALAGRKVHYKANVKSVGTVELPELDDEWVESLGEEFKTLKDLRSKLRKDMESVANADADSRVRNDLIAKLIEGNEFEVPNTLLENQAQNLLNNFAQDLAQGGVDLSKVDQSFIETTYNQMKGQATRDVTGAVLLEKIAELEKVEVGKEAVDAEIENMATRYQKTVEEVRKMMIEQQGGEDSIKSSLRTREAVEALVKKAKVTDGKWIDETHTEVEQEDSEFKEEKPKKAKEKKPEAKAEKKPAKKPAKKADSAD